MWSVKSCQFNQQRAQSQAVQIISGPLQSDDIMNSVVFIGAHSSGNSKHNKQLFNNYGGCSIDYLHCVHCGSYS